jgi:hypothetical protein
MLFDIRGKRKRLIQVTYVTLAVLFGASLVLFGTGSGVSGGLFDAFSGGGGADKSVFVQQVDDTKKRVQRNPRSEKLRLDLVRAELNVAASPEGSDSQTGSLTDKGRQAVTEAAAAWEAYLKLKPKKVDAGAGQFAALAYGALQEYDRAVATQAIVVRGKPSASAYFQLADFAWRAGENAKGDAAAKRAIALSPADQRNTVKDTIGRTEKQAKQIARAIAKAKKAASKQGTSGGGTQFGPLPGQGTTGATGAAP